MNNRDRAQKRNRLSPATVRLIDLVEAVGEEVPASRDDLVELIVMDMLQRGLVNIGDEELLVAA